jgi:hypothetical protein
MEFILVVYLIVGIVHSLNKVGNPNPAIRPVWTSDRSVSGLKFFLGFLLIAILWPISMLASHQ